MKKKLLIATILVTSFSASADFYLGEYNLNKCQVSVKQGSSPNEIEVRVSKDSQHGKVTFNRATLEIKSINTCSNSNHLDLNSRVLISDDTLALRGDCGGEWASHSAIAQFEFDITTERLQYFNMKAEVAWGFPNGIHSGIVKKIDADINCW